MKLSLYVYKPHRNVVSIVAVVSQASCTSFPCLSPCLSFFFSSARILSFLLSFSFSLSPFLFPSALPCSVSFSSSSLCLFRLTLFLSSCLSLLLLSLCSPLFQLAFSSSSPLLYSYFRHPCYSCGAQQWVYVLCFFMARLGQRDACHQPYHAISFFPGILSCATATHVTVLHTHAS